MSGSAEKDLVAGWQQVSQMNLKARINQVHCTYMYHTYMYHTYMYIVYTCISMCIIFYSVKLIIIHITYTTHVHVHMYIVHVEVQLIQLYRSIDIISNDQLLLYVSYNNYMYIIYMYKAFFTELLNLFCNRVQVLTVHPTLTMIPCPVFQQLVTMPPTQSEFCQCT